MEVAVQRLNNNEVAASRGAQLHYRATQPRPSLLLRCCGRMSPGWKIRCRYFFLRSG